MRKLLVILAVLIGVVFSGCVGEDTDKMGFIYVSDYSNLRIVVLDSDLNWVDSFSDSGTSEQSTIDGDYLFTVGPLQINKYLRKSPYTLVDTKSTSGFYDIDSDDEFVYIGITDGSDRKIQIYKKSDLSFVDEFVTGLGALIEGIAVDETYIYCFDGNVLKKFKKSDHSQVASVNILTQDGIGTWVGMDKDSTYLYFTAALAGNGELIAVYNKSDLSQYKTITISDTNNSIDVAVEGDYAFQVDYGSHFLRKVRISTGVIVATFGEEGVSGGDQSHLKSPRGVAVGVDKEGPWKEDTLEVGGGAEVEIPRRSGNWVKLEDIIRIHTSSGKDTSSPRAPIEIGQAEVTVSNISKKFNSFEEASEWFKSLVGYAVRIWVSWD